MDQSVTLRKRVYTEHDPSKTSELSENLSLDSTTARSKAQMKSFVIVHMGNGLVVDIQLPFNMAAIGHYINP